MLRVVEQASEGRECRFHAADRALPVGLELVAVLLDPFSHEANGPAWQRTGVGRRVMHQWLSVKGVDEAAWTRLAQEALAFVRGS